MESAGTQGKRAIMCRHLGAAMVPILSVYHGAPFQRLRPAVTAWCNSVSFHCLWIANEG